MGISITNLLGSILLFSCAYFSYKKDKTIISPSCIFLFTWAISLFFVSFYQSNYGFVHESGLLIYLLGGLCFLFGSFSGNKETNDTIHFNSVSVFLYSKYFLVFCLVIISPIYSYFIFALTGADSFTQHLLIIRQIALEQSIDLPFGLSQITYIYTLVIYFVLKDKDSSRYLKLMVICISLFLALISGAKSEIFRAIFFVFFSFFIINKRNPTAKEFFMFFFLLVLFFGLITVARGSSDTSFDDNSFIENLNGVLSGILKYMFSGIYSFSVYVDDNNFIKPSWDALNLFYLVLNKFDSSYIVPPIHADFVNIFAGEYTNTHTIYFSIFPFYGVFGVILFILLYSFVGGFLFQKSKMGKCGYEYSLAIFMTSLPLTIFNDSFFSIPVLYIKSILIGFVIDLFIGYRYEKNTKAHY